MPWCPKCKTEYKKGVAVCVDCGSELSDEQPEIYDYSKLCTLEKKEVAEKLIKYLEYSNIISHFEYEENELGYVVYVRDDELKKAKKAFNAFYSVELELLSTPNSETIISLKTDEETLSNKEDLSDIETLSDEETLSDKKDLSDDIVNSMDTKKDADEDNSVADIDADSETKTFVDYDGITEEEVELLQDRSQITKMMYDGGTYEKKSDKLKDLKSTAVTFFFFSFVVLILIGLNLIGIVNYLGGILQYCIVTAMAIGFLIVGINSIQRAKKVAKEAIKEAEDIQKITDWMNLNVTEDTINELKNPSLSDEANFIHIMDAIKRLIVDEFDIRDDAFLDYIVEEFYNSKFGVQSFEQEEV